jgi:hypothetical protein
MSLTAMLPERRSSAVLKETFWPSTRPHMPVLESGRMDEYILAAIIRLDEVEALLCQYEALRYPSKG